MKESKFSDAQKAFILKQGADGIPIAEICRRAGISQATYFSRLRRIVSGQHHNVSAKYLSQYAHEAAWKEDHRRLDNGSLAGRALGLALAHPVSRNWKRYWQRAA